MIHAAVLNCHGLSHQFTSYAMSILARMCTYARMSARTRSASATVASVGVSTRQQLPSRRVPLWTTILARTTFSRTLTGLTTWRPFRRTGERRPSGGKIADPAPPPDQNRPPNNPAERHTP